MFDVCADERKERSFRNFLSKRKKKKTKNPSIGRRTMASVLSEIALDEVAYIELLRKLISVAVRYILT